MYINLGFQWRICFWRFIFSLVTILMGFLERFPLFWSTVIMRASNCMSSSSSVFSKGFCLWEPMTDVILSSNLKKSVLGLFKFYSKSFMIVKYSWILTQTFPSLCFQNPSKCFSPSLPHIIRNPRRKIRCLIETTWEITNVGK